MTISPAEHHRVVAGRFSELARYPGIDWNAPTPVAEWRVRDIVGHLVEWFPAFLASGSDVTLPDGPSVDEDPVGAWESQCQAIQTVLDDASTASKMLSNPHIGTVPLPGAIDQFYVSDVFMHTWDLARATGQDAALEADTCAAMLAGMQSYEDAMRSSGQYGPRVDVGPDASAQDQLIAFIGRDPHWTPSPS